MFISLIKLTVEFNCTRLCFRLYTIYSLPLINNDNIVSSEDLVDYN